MPATVHCLRCCSAARCRLCKQQAGASGGRHGPGTGRATSRGTADEPQRQDQCDGRRQRGTQEEFGAAVGLPAAQGARRRQADRCRGIGPDRPVPHTSWRTNDALPSTMASSASSGRPDQRLPTLGGAIGPARWRRSRGQRPGSTQMIYHDGPANSSLRTPVPPGRSSRSSRASPERG